MVRRCQWTLATAIALLVLPLTGCGGGGGLSGATPRAVPSPVKVAEKPAPRTTVTDPAFEARAGARADYGRLHGAAYEIEIPENWNGGLVLYMRGNPGYQSVVSVQRPELRPYLLRRGYAWASSSYSTADNVPGTAADETAALWDVFTARYGRPGHSYVYGESMGGGGAIISAERYADRYDGALSFCGEAGRTPAEQVRGDMTLVAAFAAGVTRADWDSSSPQAVIENLVQPRLANPGVSADFVALWVRMTGGTRPLAAEALEHERDQMSLGFNASFENRGRAYELAEPEPGMGTPGIADVSAEEFNRRVIRYGRPRLAKPDPAQDITGNLQIPLLTVNVTGDIIVPLSEAQLIRRTVDDAGKGNLLVQRTVQAARHCELTEAEQEQSFQALVDWVERGQRPAGEDLLADDLSNVGADFTSLPRLGSPAADALPQAGNRVQLTGLATVDGQPLNSPFLRIIVEKDGLLADCRYTYDGITGGNYRQVIAPAPELAGCGESGAIISAETLVWDAAGRQHTVFSGNTAAWPDGGIAQVNFTFAQANPAGASNPFTAFDGEVLDANGEHLPAGTTIEAYIGDTLCALTSLSSVAKRAAEEYAVLVVGPESRAGCERGATISFRVNGQAVEQTATNDLDELQNPGHALDLIVPAER